MNVFVSPQRVIELSKQHLPHMAMGYSDPRVHVHVQDGAEFMLHHKDKFDVIITDSSDPIGKVCEGGEEGGGGGGRGGRKGKVYICIYACAWCMGVCECVGVVCMPPICLEKT